MLKGIDPLLGGELLMHLSNMGHGDRVVLGDANFTAYTLAEGAPVLRLDGIPMLRATQALLSVLPLDEAVAQPVTLMLVGGQAPTFRSTVQQGVQAAVEAACAPRHNLCEAVERFAFYDRVRGARLVIQTGEMQPFANVILQKGVIADAIT